MWSDSFPDNNFKNRKFRKKTLPLCKNFLKFSFKEMKPSKKHAVMRTEQRSAADLFRSALFFQSFF